MRAVASKPDPYARREEDRFVVRRGVSWAEFQRVLEERGERSNPRMAYLEGTLEIMSPGSHHEGLRGVIGCLVEVWCLENDIEFTTLGNWTQQDEAVARAVEPDECWVFGGRTSVVTSRCYRAGSRARKFGAHPKDLGSRT